MVSGQKAWALELNLQPHGLKTTITVLLLGAIQALAMSHLLGDSVSACLQVAAMAAFIHFVKAKTKPFLLSWMFATTWLLGSVAWLYISLHEHGGMHMVLSVLAILMLCGGLAAYYAVTVYLYLKIENKLPHVLSALLLAAAWTLAEMARAQWFTGFPWSAVGYAHVNSYLSFAAPVVGVYGVGFMAIFVAGMLANTWAYKASIQNWGWMLLLFGLLMPAVRSESKSDVQISFALLQANIPQELKYAGGRDEALNWYKAQLIQTQAQVTVLPETAVPYFKTDLPNGYWEEIENAIEQQEKAAIIGIPTQNPGYGYGNSALALGMTSGPTQYNKVHLVPFGEFTPQAFKWFNNLVDLGLTDFIRGSDKPAPFVWRDTQLSVNICYEDLFGEELAKRFVMGEENRPDILVNISNLGWFGDNYVVDQHLNIARMRSLEFERPTVRATNSGGTAIINAQGKIEAVLKPYTRGVLLGQVQARSTGVTPFAYWAGHWGLKPLWAWCLLIWAISIWRYKRRPLR